MAELAGSLNTQTETQDNKPRGTSLLARVAKYSLFRAVSLLFVVVISVYLTVLVTNKGAVIESEFDRPGTIGGWFSGIGEPKIHSRTNQDAGPQEPVEYMMRSLRLVFYGLTLNLGETERTSYFVSSKLTYQVSDIVLDALPRTLLLFGTANVLIFFTSISMALLIFRKYGSRLEKLFLALTPLSAVPPWIYGLILNIVLARVFHIFIGGRLDTWPDEFSWSFLPVLIKHLGPPILAIFISKFFLSVYTWRSFFLIFAGEDYIDLARAKGLPEKLIEKRYILRPALPSFVTSFAMLMVGIWQEAIIIELFFSVAGVGQLYYNVIRLNDMPLIIGLVVIFAYLMAATVFLLDILYALLDPRVKVGTESRLDKAVSGKKQKGLSWFRDWMSAGGERSRPAAPPAARKQLQEANTGKAPGLSGSGPIHREPWRDVFRRWTQPVRELAGAPSALFGLAIILVFLGVSIYVPFAMPLREALQMWDRENPIWLDNPKQAAPVWVNFFRKNDLPESIFMDSRSSPAIKEVQAVDDEVSQINISFPVEYPYRGLPQSFSLRLAPEFARKYPYAAVTWLTPDGREIELGDFTVPREAGVNFTRDGGLRRVLGDLAPEIGLFLDPDSDGNLALPGRYELRISAYTFEAGSDLNAELEIMGQVHGWAGTDVYRRDLGLGLLWGVPFALGVGLLGAVGTTLTTMLIAAIGAWYGGWVDGLIQRITEVNIILPAFPLLLIIHNHYSKSFWVILGAAILLNIFGSGIKTYRSTFLQLRSAPYIEAAQTYGAGNWRIIFRYLTPRIAPVLVPQLVMLVPTFVFLEVTLAYLKMSDPVLPTLGKVLQEGLENGGLNGAYHWVLEPAGILLAIGFAFLMVGFSLERILNPRLRDI